MINDFDVCPARYKAVWVDKVTSGPNEAAHVGTMFHDWASDFFDFVDKTHMEEMKTEADLTEYLVAATTDPRGHPLLLTCCYNFIDFEVKHLMMLRKLFEGDKEKVWFYWVPYEVERYFETDEFEGTIDRVDNLTDGNLLIWEYKTTRAPHPTEHRRDVSWYADIANKKNLFDGKRVTMGGVMWVQVPQFWTFEISDRTIAAINKRIADMNKCHKEGYFPFIVTPLCPYCPVFGSCPAIRDPNYYKDK
jgi:hypothetical protein